MAELHETLETQAEAVPSAYKSENLGECYIQAIRQNFPSAVLDVERQTRDQVTVSVKLEYLPEVVEFLYYKQGGWLPVLWGNDERTIHGSYAIYYALSMEEAEKCWIVIRSLVDPARPEFPSVTTRVPAAVWGEREIRDMYGLTPVGIPDARRLVLPDDWPEDLYPLRKDTMDYRQRPAPTTDTETYSFLNERGDKKSRIVPIGPMHVTSDEPGHFRLFVDGETILDADYRMFYVHRGMEKAAETRMGYQEISFLAERVCGICGYAHSIAYTNSIENAIGLEVPERAHWIRTLMLESERLHSHFLNLGLVCHFTGFDSGFQQFFRVREKSMTIAELVTGSRKTYGLNLVGGIRRDLLENARSRTLKLLDEIEKETEALVDMLVNTTNYDQRTRGVGILDKKVARDYSPVGPMIRGSGFNRDIRKDHSYAAYGKIPMNVFSFDGCDVASRVMVRIKEVFDSLAQCRFVLENLPAGPVLIEGFTYKPYKYALGYTEAPRGEDVHWSMTGNNQKAFRWRCRAATYANWPVLRYALQGNTVSDAALIIGSLDPCYSCTDRVTLVDVKKQKATTIPYQDMERYGIDRKHSPLGK